MPKLTPKQERFCQEYIIDLNATQAAIRAGYSAKTARQIATDTLSKPYIAEHIQSLQKPITDKALIDAEYVLTRLKKIVERCMEDETYDASGANRALELLGKHLVLFTDHKIIENVGDPFNEIANVMKFLSSRGIQIPTNPVKTIQ